MRILSLKRVPLHPIFFGVYPILALLAYNIGEISIKSAIRSFVLASLLSLVTLFIGRLILKDWQRAGLFSSTILISFFSYGHIYNFLTQLNGIGDVIGRHRILIPIFAFTIGFGLWWVFKKVSDWNSLTSILNLISIVLLIFPVYQVTSYLIRTRSAAIAAVEGAENALGQFVFQPKEKPDIYYIISDSYTRQDVLLEKYGYDNTPFIEELRALGFFVDDCGQSNYSKTAFSLASTLNLDYVDTFGDEDLFHLDQEGRPNQVKFGALIQNNKTRSFLETIGYKTISFDTGFNWLNWSDADLFLHHLYDTPPALHESILFGAVNEFESLLVQTSIGLVFIDMSVIIGFDLKMDIDNENFIDPLDVKTGGLRQQYKRALYILDTLEEIVELDGPKFVYAHLYPPHLPYFILPDGQFNKKDIQDESGYPKEVAFLNDQFISIFETILANAERPSIIILQSDHGAAETIGDPARVYILNAIYLPNGGGDLLYPSITPVNTFRLIFDYYFGLDLRLLEDTSYNHEPYKHVPGNFINFVSVPNSCK